MSLKKKLERFNKAVKHEADKLGLKFVNGPTNDKLPFAKFWIRSETNGVDRYVYLFTVANVKSS